MLENGVKKQVLNRNSIGMFDLSRGALMLFVILGHSVTLFYKYWEVEQNFSVWMLPFAAGKVLIYGLIPMFFMMSGYGFRKQKMKRCISDRVRFLLKPYLYVAVITILLVAAKKILLGKPVVEALQYQGLPFVLGLCPGETHIFGWYTGTIGPMWFLVALCISWIGLNIIFRLENGVLRCICIMTLTAFCTSLPFYALIPFCIIQSLNCIAYLYIGYCIKKNKLLVQKLSRQTYILLIFILVCVVPFGNVDVSQNVWKAGFLDFMASCIAGFLLCRLAVSLEGLEGRIANFLRLLGKNSLYLLCVHTVEYLVFPWDKLAEKFAGHMTAGILVVLLARSIMVGLGCFGINVIIRLRRGRR